MNTILCWYSRFLLVLILFSSEKIIAQHEPDSLANKVNEKVEIEASFPGGDVAWAKFVIKGFENAGINFKNADQGTCIIKFIVDKHGNTSNVEALNMKKTRLAKFAVDLISNGPKWKPAYQDGKYVNAFREQPITLTLQ